MRNWCRRVPFDWDTYSFSVVKHALPVALSLNRSAPENRLTGSVHMVWKTITPTVSQGTCPKQKIQIGRMRFTRICFHQFVRVRVDSEGGNWSAMEMNMPSKRQSDIEWFVLVCSLLRKQFQRIRGERLGVAAFGIFVEGNGNVCENVTIGKQMH